MSKLEYQFKDKIILITGSTQGMGSETARLFASRGAKGITICGRNIERGEALRKMTQVLISFNGDVWKAKKDANLSLNSPISGVTIPLEIKLLKDALTKMHKLE